jgi:hypothetical protein
MPSSAEAMMHGPTTSPPIASPCPTCGSRVPDTLAVFLAAYDLAGAVLADGADAPAHENSAFASLRRRYPRVLHALRAAAGEGRKRTTTGHDERVLRWTITRQPAADATGACHFVVLAQDAGDWPSSDPEEEEDGQSSKGSTATAHRFTSSHASIDGKTPSPPHTLTGPSDYFTAFPFPPTPHEFTPAIPRTLDPDRSWMSDPRCAALVSGGGEMGDLLRAVDWAHTPLGPVTSWSTTQIMIFAVTMHSRFPTSIFWGPHNYLIYNSYYADILGPAKHPQSFAKPASKIWAEIWKDIAPYIQDTLAGNTLFKQDDQLLIYRGNRETIEEAYFTWSYIPIYDGNAAVAVYNPVYETTGKVFSERRMRALQQLATRLTTARTLSGLVADTCEVLGQLEDDLPYAAAYVVQKDEFVGRATGSITLILQETIAIPFDAPAAPNKLVVDPLGPSPIPYGAPSGWPIDLKRTAGHHELSLHAGVAPLLAQLPLRGSTGQPATRAASLPIVQGNELVGVLLLYIGSGVPVDDQMSNFLDVLARQCSTSASMVESYENELQSKSFLYLNKVAS